MKIHYRIQRKILFILNFPSRLYLGKRKWPKWNFVFLDLDFSVQNHENTKQKLKSMWKWLLFMPLSSTQKHVKISFIFILGNRPPHLIRLLESLVNRNSDSGIKSKPTASKISLFKPPGPTSHKQSITALIIKWVVLVYTKWLCKNSKIAMIKKWTTLSSASQIKTMSDAQVSAHWTGGE